MAFRAFYREDIRDALQSNELVLDLIARFAEQEMRKVAQELQTIEDMGEHIDIYRQGLLGGLSCIAINFGVDI